MTDINSQHGAQEIPIDGECDPRFAAVREAFLINFTDDGDWGASVCVMIGGRPVVDLFGGFQDKARSVPWRHDTLVNAYSTGKGVLAMLALDAVGRGEVSLDDPVCRLWPDFAGQGKSRISLRMLLAHRAGLPAIRPMLPPEAKYQWATMCAALAAERPFWEPDTAHGYHANSYGFLIGEVLRRATGREPGALLRERLAGPAGADYYWGVPAREHARIAPVLLLHESDIAHQQAQGEALMRSDGGEPDHKGMVWRGYFNPPGMSGFGSVNTTDWRNAVIPSSNGHANAAAIARIYDAWLFGLADESGERTPLASDALRTEAARIHSDGEDVVLGRPSRFGLGFQLPQPNRPIGPNPASYGHFGHGGSLGFADPDAGLAFGYVTNRPGARFLASRAMRVTAAVYEALG